MSLAGTKVSSESIQDFEDLKKGKQYRYLILALDDKVEYIITLVKGARDATYNEMVSHLTEDRPCYVIYDFEYTFDDNGIDREVSKLVLLHWCSDKAKVRPRMVSASSIKELTTKLLGIQKNIPIKTLGDLNYDEVIKQL